MASIFVAAVIELKDVIHGAIFELKIEPWNLGECTSIYTLPYLGSSVLATTSNVRRPYKPCDCEMISKGWLKADVERTGTSNDHETQTKGHKILLHDYMTSIPVGRILSALAHLHYRTPDHLHN